MADGTTNGTTNGTADGAEPRDGRPRREAFAERYAFPLRWRDDDVYGHLNNVVYLEYFDTAVARWLRERGGLDAPRGPVIGLVVETTCRYHASVSFPDMVEVGVGIERVGRTSATYRLALFGPREPAAAATCRFVHVYVDAKTRRPTPLPETLRAALERLPRA